MASACFLEKRFYDVLVYLNSIKVSQEKTNRNKHPQQFSFVRSHIFVMMIHLISIMLNRKLEKKNGLKPKK